AAVEVNPTRSAKTTVTTLRSSCGVSVTSASGVAQALQKRAPPGFSCPQLGHLSMGKAYDGEVRPGTVSNSGARHSVCRPEIARAPYPQARISMKCRSQVEAPSSCLGRVFRLARSALYVRLQSEGTSTDQISKSRIRTSVSP